MSSYNIKQITVFTGLTLNVHLLDRRESNHLQVIHEARNSTSKTLAALDVFQLNDGRVLEKREYYDRDYLFNSLADYKELKGSSNKDYESVSLLHDNNYNLLYSCQVASSYLARIIENKSVKIVRELPASSYNLCQISEHIGLFYILKDHRYSSAM